MKVTEIITDKQLDHVWENAKFGSVSRRDTIRFTLLRFACGYRSGHTAQVIITELGLITEKGKLTKKGREYLFKSFED